MSIFIVKMGMAVAPVFMSINNKTVNAVINQLEQETKNEKEDPDKGSLKEKKFFDETCLFIIDFKPLIIQAACHHHQHNLFYFEAYHPVVPTPPPSA